METLYANAANQQAGGFALGQIATPPQGFTERSCEHLRQLIDVSRDTVNTLAMLNERMFGPVPTAGNNPKAEVHPSAMGRADQMDQLMAELGAVIDRVREEAQRANNRI